MRGFVVISMFFVAPEQTFYRRILLSAEEGCAKIYPPFKWDILLASRNIFSSRATCKMSGPFTNTIPALTAPPLLPSRATWYPHWINGVRSMDKAVASCFPDDWENLRYLDALIIAAETVDGLRTRCKDSWRRAAESAAEPVTRQTAASLAEMPETVYIRWWWLVSGSTMKP